MQAKATLKTVFPSLIAVALWGSLFPMVKLGYKAFGIHAGSIPDILMFASIRFLFCGLIVCGYSFIKREKVGAAKVKSIRNIVLMGLFAIVLHYTFTYISLSTTDSSKTAILKQLGSLFYICFAFLFFQSEKFSLLKIIGAFLGFSGIIAINFHSGGIAFAISDLFIIAASFCSTISGIITKKSLSDCSPFWTTGISQFFGGAVLFTAALAMGGQIPVFNLNALCVFLYICTASIVSYCLWYYALSKNNLSNMTLIKFAEPLFACIFSAFFLGENIFRVQYLLAFGLISGGILLGNKKETFQ